MNKYLAIWRKIRKFANTMSKLLPFSEPIVMQNEQEIFTNKLKQITLMKKIFTLIAGILMSLGLQAQTYSFAGITADKIIVESNGTIGTTTMDEVSIPSVSYSADPANELMYVTISGMDKVKVAYKNNAAKSNILKFATDFMQVDGKNGVLFISGLTAGQVISLQVSAKGGTASVFSAEKGCDADASNPASVSKAASLEEYVTVKFTATDSEAQIKETSGGFRITTMTIGDGEQGGSQPSSSTIDYPTSKNGITLMTTDDSQVSYSTVKIHKDADVVNCIKFGKSYIYAESDEYYYALLEMEGGFKSGDVITIAGVYNNKDEKNAAIAFRSDPASTEPLWVTDNFINGKNNESDPVTQTYTLAADAAKLYIGRSGNTGTCVTLLKVTRGTTGISEMLNIKVDSAVYNLAGQKVGKDYKGVVISNGKKMIQK